MVISEDEVKKSFARVKEDILQVKRSLNKQLFSVEEIGKTAGNALAREEFYAFIKRLGSKIEELESSFPAKSDKEDVDAVASELRDEIAALGKILQQRDGLADEVREVRSLKGKVLELEGSSVSRAEFSKDTTRLKADFASVKASAAASGKVLGSLSDSVSSSLSKLSANLADLSAKFNSLTAKAVVKEDISSFTDRIESSHQEALRGFAALKRDVDKKTAFTSAVEGKLSAFAEKMSESESSIASSLSKLGSNLADFGAKLNSLTAKAVVKDDIAAFTGRIESSRDEMSREFFSLKREFDKKVHDAERKVEFVSSFEEKLSALGEKLAEAERSVDSLKEGVPKKFVDKPAYEKAIGELKSKIGEVQRLLESSTSEVNLDDYATKRLVKQQFASLSESLGSSISAATGANSDFSSKLSGVEEQLRSVKSQLDFFQKGTQKQLDKEMRKFAAQKDLDRIRGDVERMSSDFIPSGEFYSKVDRLEGASAKAYDDFRKEVKRQREFFDEHLKFLESYHRSSNDALKAEVEQLRSSIKALSKAGEQAKVEMAKISTSAAKVAAKTAADLIEEAEEDAKGSRYSRMEGRRGKGLSPLSVSVMIVVLLLIGSVSYVVLKGREAPVQPQDNFSQRIIPPITSGSEPVAQQPEEQTLPLPQLQAPETSNAAPNAAIPSNASSDLSVEEPSANVSPIVSGLPADRNEECRELLECKQRPDGQFGFDCYFDNVSSQCRCFVGGIEKCPKLMVENESSAGKQLEGEKEGGKGRAPGSGVRYYGVVAFIVLVVAFFAYRALFVKEDGEEKQGEKAGKAAKSSEKPKSKEGKDNEKPSEDEGDDIIDLEEFFEKKEPKKK